MAQRFLLPVRRNYEQYGNYKAGQLIHRMNNKKYILASAAGALLVFAQVSSGVTLQGNPFRPTGANFTITAVQGISDANPQGVSGVSPQVNRDFEFQGTTGVSYDTGGGHLTDFGLGLYTSGASTFST